jgi:hypothetical protein
MSLFWPKVAECSRVMLAGCAVMTETKITHTLVFLPLVICVNKLPATPEANNSAHYCFGFEEGNDITASALKGIRQ